MNRDSQLHGGNTPTRLVEYKMAAWWWSVPYSIVCPLFAAVFDLEKYGHNLMLLPYTLLFVTWISTILWALVALCRLTVTHSMRWSRKMTLMVLGSAIGCAMWPLMEKLTALFAVPGG